MSTTPSPQVPGPLAGSDRSITLLPTFDLPGTVRRVRRRLRMSQRALAQASGLAPSTVARAETGRQDLSACTVAALAAMAGLRLALLDEEGREVTSMRPDAVRDRGYRRYPAHADVRHGDEGWWFLPHRYGRNVPWYTFDLRDDLPLEHDDHPSPSPVDDPRLRAELRRTSAAIAWQEHQQASMAEHQRKLAAGEIQREPEVHELCTCPPECEELLIGDDPAGHLDPHVANCPCRCDIG